MTPDVCKVWFGGSYREHWTENYSMSVIYEGRRFVEAGPVNGRWEPVGGDRELAETLRSPGCPWLTQTYFQAAATAYSAVHTCLKKGLALDRLRECLYSQGNPLTAPELMRLLMDDCGLPLSTAYQVAAHCCDELRGSGVSEQELMSLQPRTAHVMSLLRQSSRSELAVSHNARLPEHRSVFGAACCGDSLRLAFSVLGGSPVAASLVLWSDGFEKQYPMEREGELYTASVVLPDRPMALWYAFHIESANNSSWLCPDYTGYIGRIFAKRESGFRLTVYLRDFETPAWFRRAVMYQVFPDRFGFSRDGTAERGVEYHRALGQTPELHRSLDEPVRWQARSVERDYSPDDFYGGTFKGIEEKLPYLKSLGVSCLYLNPIVEARSNHRYDTSDYHRPDPILGTMEDFQRLCQRAGEMGIRLILDGVYSHTGADSRYFDRYGHYGGRGACSGRDSEYYDWYDFKSFPEEYRCWWGFKDLPEVNERDPKWQKDVVSGPDSVVKLWLRAGASGWRLDVADELPDETLELIRIAVKSVAPDAPIVGEVWEDAVVKESYGKRRRYALGCSLDSVMNYPFRFAMLDFIHGRMDAYALRDLLAGQQMNYPRPFYYSLMNLLGSHDVERLRTALAVDCDIRALRREAQMALTPDGAALDRALELEKLCACVQFAIPGVPSIYYGDEQGMCGVCDPFNRQPFREDTTELRDFYAGLAELRNSAPALSTGEAVFMAEDRDLLLILRYITGGRDVFGVESENGAYLAVINRGDRSSEYRADCSPAGLPEHLGKIGPRSSAIVRLA